MSTLFLESFGIVIVKALRRSIKQNPLQNTIFEWFFLSLYVRCSRCFFFFFFWWRCLLRNANENKTQFNHSTFQENYRVYQQNPLHKCYLNCTGETPIFSTAFAIVSVLVPFDSCLDNISIVQIESSRLKCFFFVSFSMMITCAHVLSMFCV